jgi:UDP-N-acetylmuramoyl-tripeptide--D-alanyl-D-alanine ligase
VLFGRDRRFEVSAENWRGTVHGMRFDLRIGGRLLDVALPLPGSHNVSNFLAAAAAAHALGLTPEQIAERASELRPAPHRGELLRLEQALTLLDDCYNSNPAAVEAAIAALGLCAGQRRVAFLGDMLELGPDGPALHREVGRGLLGRVDVLGAVGTLAGELLAGGRKAGLAESDLHAFPDAAQAALAAPGLVRAGDAVLVKGSRGVRMERIVEALVARFGPVLA